MERHQQIIHFYISICLHSSLLQSALSAPACSHPKRHRGMAVKVRRQGSVVCVQRRNHTWLKCTGGSCPGMPSL